MFFNKTKTKRNLKISLLFTDAILLIVVFFSVYFLFENFIKKILVVNNIDNFYNNSKESQFDLMNSIVYVEEKRELSYTQYIKEIFTYIKLSSLKRTRYNNSLVAIILPESENLIIAGNKNNPDIKNKSDLPKYDYFRKMIVKQSGKKNKSNKNYITFNFDNKKYIGIALFTETGVRKNLDRNNNELVYPIFLIADRDNEFFYLIYKVRNLFYIVLGIIFVLSALFKIYNTFVITKEIYNIRDKMMNISRQIREKGLVHSTTKDLITRFIETTNLNTSFNDLVTSLIDLGDIISGIADKDLFTATLKKDNSILNPHKELMTVLFLDVEGFTSITEKHKENIFVIINHIWSEVENIIEKHNGKINKFIGDACLVIFRELDAQNGTNSSINALYSAIELLQVVPEICKDLNITFNFRVGLDFGEITYGKTGSDQNYELGVIGDTVNIASRLEALCKQYYINFLLTNNVLRNIELILKDNHYTINNHYFKMYKVDKVRPKGKKEALEIFTALMKKDNEDDIYAISGSDIYFHQKYYNFYHKLLTDFFKSFSHWEEYMKIRKDPDKKESLEIHKNKAITVWSIIAKDFAVVYKSNGFPLAYHFVKMILKFEELEVFNKTPDEWLTRYIYQVKIPDEEWVKLKSIEMEK